MSVTDDTSQSSMGALKVEAPSNMPDMRVTADTSQPPMSWLKSFGWMSSGWWNM